MKNIKNCLTWTKFEYGKLDKIISPTPQRKSDLKLQTSWKVSTGWSRRIPVNCKTSYRLAIDYLGFQQNIFKIEAFK